MVLICKVTLSVRRGKGRARTSASERGFSHYFCVGEGDCRVNLICSSRIMIGQPLPPKLHSSHFPFWLDNNSWIIPPVFPPPPCLPPLPLLWLEKWSANKRLKVLLLYGLFHGLVFVSAVFEWILRILFNLADWKGMPCL